MAVVEQGDGRLVLGMVEGAQGLVALHHRHGLAAQRAAQAFKLGDQVRNVADGVLENQTFQRLRVINGVLDCQPAAPGVPQHVHATQVQGLAHAFDLGHVAGDVPQAVVIRAVGGAGAQLVEGNHADTLVLEPGMGVAQVVARQPRPAIEAQQHLVTFAKAVHHDVVAIDLYIEPLVRLHLTPHRYSPVGHGLGL